jgi:hypothetical protein
MTMTLAAETPGPYVYVDNRAVVLCNGQTGVLFNRAQARWLGETLQIVADEGRATRLQAQHVFGGFTSGAGAAVLFGGTLDDLVTVRLSGEAFAQLRAELEPGR